MLHENDLRLANCGLVLTQSVSVFGFLRYMLLLTNDRIYAVFQAIFSLVGNPLGFTAVRPVARRKPNQ